MVFSKVSKEESLKLFKELVSTQGHKAIESKESLVVEKIKNWFLENDIFSEEQFVEKNRSNVYGIIEGKSGLLKLMFNGHTDTIPGFDMDIEPFIAKVEDEKLFGRGACDMKAGIAAFMTAMLAIKRNGLELEHSVGFAGVIDEEERSKGTEAMLRWKYKPEHVIIGEPTSLQVCTAHKGMEWIEIEFQGKSTHGSRPKEGINAIYMASSLVKKIETKLEPQIDRNIDPLLGPGTICVGVINGGDDPNIVPSKATIRIDRRYLPSQSLEDIYNEVQLLCDEVSIEYNSKIKVRGLDEFTASMKNRPYSLEESDPYVKELIKITSQVLDKEVKISAFPAWSDAGLLGNHSDAKCIVMGPGNINDAHSANEFCSLDEYYKACEIYYKLITNMCMGGK